MNFGGGGNSQPNTVTTTQTKDPWAGAQPYLNQINATAQMLYNNDWGNTPYSGATQVPWSQQLQNALQTGTGMAEANLGGTSGVNAARGLSENVINSQGITPGIQSSLTGLGGVSGQYGSIYNDASGQTNPYLQSTLDAQGRKIGDQVNSAMSGAGRYGSGAHTNVLSRNLAEAAYPILAQDYQNRQQTRLAATQGMGATQQSMADLYGQGLNRAGQYSQLAPALDQARYADLDRLMGIGNYITNYNQAGLQGSINQQNAIQAHPWEQLARYNAIVGGSGQLGGTQVNAVPVQQPSLLQSIGGGALVGAGLGSAFGPAGTAVGGVGGGLLGLLGR